MRALRYGLTSFFVAALLLLGCTKRNSDIFPTPSGTAANLQQWFQQQNVSSSNQWPKLIQWSSLESYGSGNSRIYTVTLADPNSHRFDETALKGTRRLVLWTDSQGEQQANLIEIYRKGAELPTGQEFQQLLSSLTEGLRTGHKPVLSSFEGMAVIYNIYYKYNAGYVFKNGQIAGNYKIHFSSKIQAGGQRGSNPTLSSARFQSTLATASSCNGFFTCDVICGTVTVGDGSSGSTTDCTEANCQPITTTPGGPPSSGGGGTGDGGGNWGGGGSQSSTPKLIPRMPTAISPQVGGGACVPTALAVAQIGLCGGVQSTILGPMYIYGGSKFGGLMNFTERGVPGDGMDDFVNHFFNVSNFNKDTDSFTAELDAGHPIVIDIFQSQTGNDVYTHAVTIIGYDQDDLNTVYYIDPADGSMKSGDGSSLLSSAHFAFAITGCK